MATALGLFIKRCVVFLSIVGLIPTCKGQAQLVLSATNPTSTEYCSSLGLKETDIVHFPGSLQYEAQQSNYWSGQQARDLLPSCRVVPTTTVSLGRVIKYLVQHNVSFAVQSGGHSSVIGASNLDDGIVIDLHRLNKVELSADLKSVTVGVGSRWLDVYLALEPYQLTVPGARSGSVGVGGFLLGGGLSWLSNSRGWACDSIREFQIVLAGGETVEASKRSHSDLFWALKGSGGVFGVVATVTLSTVVAGDVYGGAVGYRASELEPLLEALDDHNRRTTTESEASAYLSFGVLSNQQEMSIVAYTVDRSTNRSDPAMEAFAGIPQYQNNQRIMNYSSSAAEIGLPQDRGRRGTKFTITMQSNIGVMKQLVNTFQHRTKGICLHETDVVGMTLQPLPVAHTQGRDNALGLASQSEPLIIVSVELLWTGYSKDQVFTSIAQDLYLDMSKITEKHHADHQFIYLNYAATYQEPLKTYGSASLERLRRTQLKYDPAKAMSRLRKGAFDLW